MPWTAAAIGGSSLLSGITGLIGANKAADASRQAAEQQMRMYQTTRADLAPFRQAGQDVLPALDALALSGPYGGGPNYVQLAGGIGVGPQGQAALEQTPGYQFQMQQARQQLASGMAARGLGVSGAALKGAATYATGLASSNYQQQFANALALNTAQQTNLNNQYTRLHDTAAIGGNAAAQTGTAGTAAANAAGGFMNQAGQANAAGVVGIGSAAAQGVNNYIGYQNYQNQTAMNQQALNNQTAMANAMSGQTGGYGANALAYQAAMNPTSPGAYGPGF